MTDTFIENFANQLIEAGLVDQENPITGITAGEIEQIENKFQIKLPEIYRQYLLKMGESSGDFNSGSDFWYPEILDFRQVAEVLLAKHLPEFKLPVSAFVFGMHQGYQFWYFDTSDGDNPPVFYYLEGQAPPVQKFQSYSDLLEAMLEDHIRVLQKSIS